MGGLLDWLFGQPDDLCDNCGKAVPAGDTFCGRRCKEEDRARIWFW